MSIAPSDRSGSPSPDEELAEDAELFGFDLSEPGWLQRFTALCAVDDHDDEEVARWWAWLRATPPSDGPPSHASEN